MMSFSDSATSALPIPQAAEVEDFPVAKLEELLPGKLGALSRRTVDDDGLFGLQRRFVIGRTRIGLCQELGERDVDRPRHLAGRHQFGRLAHVDDDRLAIVEQRLSVLGVDPIDDVRHCGGS